MIYVFWGHFFFNSAMPFAWIISSEWGNQLENLEPWVTSAAGNSSWSLFLFQSSAFEGDLVFQKETERGKIKIFLSWPISPVYMTLCFPPGSFFLCADQTVGSIQIRRFLLFWLVLGKVDMWKGINLGKNNLDSTYPRQGYELVTTRGKRLWSCVELHRVGDGGGRVQRLPWPPHNLALRSTWLGVGGCGCNWKGKARPYGACLGGVGGCGGAWRVVGGGMGVPSCGGLWCGAEGGVGGFSREWGMIGQRGPPCMPQSWSGRWGWEGCRVPSGHQVAPRPPLPRARPCSFIFEPRVPSLSPAN